MRVSHPTTREGLRRWGDASLPTNDEDDDMARSKPARVQRAPTPEQLGYPVRLRVQLSTAEGQLVITDTELARLADTWGVSIAGVTEHEALHDFCQRMVSGATSWLKEAVDRDPEHEPKIFALRDGVATPVYFSTQQAGHSLLSMYDASLIMVTFFSIITGEDGADPAGVLDGGYTITRVA